MVRLYSFIASSICIILNSSWYIPHIIVILIGALFDSYEEAKFIVPGSKHINLVDIKLSKVTDFYNVVKEKANAFPVKYAAYK